MSGVRDEWGTEVGNNRRRSTEVFHKGDGGITKRVSDFSPPLESNITKTIIRYSSFSLKKHNETKDLENITCVW